jgi:hypothetical protein
LELDKHQKHLKAFWALWDHHGDELLSDVDSDPEAEFFDRFWKPWKKIP